MNVYLHCAHTGLPAVSRWVPCMYVCVCSNARLPFERVRHLRNGTNGNKEAKVGRDGQEMDPAVGAQLVALFHANAGTSLSQGPSDEVRPLIESERERESSMQRERE